VSEIVADEREPAAFIHKEKRQSAVSATGRLIEPTGIGQIEEVTLQLRGEAGARQQPNARNRLATTSSPRRH